MMQCPGRASICTSARPPGLGLPPLPPACPGGHPTLASGPKKRENSKESACSLKTLDTNKSSGWASACPWSLGHQRAWPCRRCLLPGPSLGCLTSLSLFPSWQNGATASCFLRPRVFSFMCQACLQGPQHTPLLSSQTSVWLWRAVGAHSTQQT